MLGGRGRLRRRCGRGRSCRCCQFLSAGTRWGNVPNSLGLRDTQRKARQAQPTAGLCVETLRAHLDEQREALRVERDVLGHVRAHAEPREHIHWNIRIRALDDARELRRAERRARKLVARARARGRWERVAMHAHCARWALRARRGRRSEPDVFAPRRTGGGTCVTVACRRGEMIGGLGLRVAIAEARVRGGGEPAGDRDVEDDEPAGGGARRARGPGVSKLKRSGKELVRGGMHAARGVAGLRGDELGLPGKGEDEGVEEEDVLVGSGSVAEEAHGREEGDGYLARKRIRRTVRKR